MFIDKKKKTFHLKKNYSQYIKLVLTAVGDVKSSARHWVIRLKLQLQHVAVRREVRGNLGAREAAHQRAPWLVPILDGEEVVWRLQVKVVERQMNPGAWLRDDQPNAVEVVSIALWVVGRQHSPHRRSEVGETGNWQDKEGKKWNIYQKAASGREFVSQQHSDWSRDCVYCGFQPQKAQAKKWRTETNCQQCVTNSAIRRQACSRGYWLAGDKKLEGDGVPDWILKNTDKWSVSQQAHFTGWKRSPLPRRCNCILY